MVDERGMYVCCPRGATAMICRDLRTVGAFPLASELALRPVRRLTDDVPDGVPLTQAVAAAGLADPRITDPRALVGDHCRCHPRSDCSRPSMIPVWCAPRQDRVRSGQRRPRSS